MFVICIQTVGQINFLLERNGIEKMCKPRNNNCEITRTVMQYYIHYNGLHCVQKEGLVVGVPFSSI